MIDKVRYNLEVLESYESGGRKRFRVLYRSEWIIVNVEAEDEEEAKSKAIEILKDMGIIRT